MPRKVFLPAFCKSIFFWNTLEIFQWISSQSKLLKAVFFSLPALLQDPANISFVAEWWSQLSFRTGWLWYSLKPLSTTLPHTWTYSHTICRVALSCRHNTSSCKQMEVFLKVKDDIINKRSSVLMAHKSLVMRFDTFIGFPAETVTFENYLGFLWIADHPRSFLYSNILANSVQKHSLEEGGSESNVYCFMLCRNVFLNPSREKHMLSHMSNWSCDIRQTMKSWLPSDL